jgi:hypothetical protein
MKRRHKLDDILVYALIAAFLIAAIGLAVHFYKPRGQGRKAAETHYRSE